MDKDDPVQAVECVECGYHLHDGLEAHEACTECGYPVRLSRMTRQTMTRRDLAVLGCRVIAVAAAVLYIVPTLTNWVYAMLWAFEDPNILLLAVVTSSIFPALHIGVAVVLWVKAPWLARKIFPTDAGVRASLNGIALMRVGLFLLGVYFVVSGGAKFLAWVLSLLHDHNWPWWGMGPGEYASLNTYWVSAVAYVASGWILIRQPTWLIRAMRKRA